MKKRVIAAVGIVALTVSMSITAFAAPPVGYGYGLCGGGYSLMRDINGNFLDKDSFTRNIDKAIEDGYVRAEDREAFVERYDYCTTYGGGFMGGGCGRGRGWR